MKDMRYTKVENALKVAITELLKEKTVNKITIVELCKAASINKSTFYLHYSDIYDYYESLAQHVASELSEIIGRYSYEELISSFNIIFPKIIYKIKNDKLMQIMLNKNNCDTVIKNLNISLIKTIINKNSDNLDDIAMVGIKTTFITAGTLGVLQNFSEEVFDTSEVSTILANQIKNGFLS